MFWKKWNFGNGSLILHHLHQFQWCHHHAKFLAMTKMGGKMGHIITEWKYPNSKNHNNIEQCSYFAVRYGNYAAKQLCYVICTQNLHLMQRGLIVSIC